MPAHSETWTFVDGSWVDGNPGLTGPRSHAFWQASSVFDGARFFEGVMPDMALHAARLNRSALALGLEPTMGVEEIVALVPEGTKRFGPDAQLYIRPMYWPNSTARARSRRTPNPPASACASTSPRCPRRRPG